MDIMGPHAKDVLESFKEMPGDIKRKILRTFRIMKVKEQLRPVRVTHTTNTPNIMEYYRTFIPNIPYETRYYHYSSIWICDGVKCLLLYSTLTASIECGIEKERGLGFRYGIKFIDKTSTFNSATHQMDPVDGLNQLQSIAPTSRAFTPAELVKIVRALCNVIRYVSRLTHDTEFINNMKHLASLAKDKLLGSLKSKTPWTIVAPGYNPRVRDQEQLCRDLHRVVKALLAGKTIMMWDY